MVLAIGVIMCSKWGWREALDIRFIIWAVGFIARLSISGVERKCGPGGVKIAAKRRGN